MESEEQEIREFLKKYGWLLIAIGVVANLIWFVLTIALAHLCAQALIGQVKAICYILDNDLLGFQLATALSPAALLYGIIWAFSVMWLMPLALVTRWLGLWQLPFLWEQ